MCACAVECNLTKQEKNQNDQNTAIFPSLSNTFFMFCCSSFVSQAFIVLKTLMVYIGK